MLNAVTSFWLHSVPVALQDWVGTGSCIYRCSDMFRLVPALYAEQAVLDDTRQGTPCIINNNSNIPACVV